MALEPIEWEAPEFEYHEKDPLWYWGSMIIAVIILGIAIWQKNFLFATFIVVAEILLMTIGGKQPRLIRFRIDDRGFEIIGDFPFMQQPSRSMHRGIIRE